MLTTVSVLETPQSFQRKKVREILQDLFVCLSPKHTSEAGKTAAKGKNAVLMELGKGGEEGMMEVRERRDTF